MIKYFCDVCDAEIVRMNGIISDRMVEIDVPALVEHYSLNGDSKGVYFNGHRNRKILCIDCAIKMIEACGDQVRRIPKS